MKRIPHTPGMFQLNTTTNPAPKVNKIITLLFALGCVGLFVNAVTFEPQRCTVSTVVSYGTKGIADCRALLGSFPCAKEDGSGTDVFDANSCASHVCTSGFSFQSRPFSECSNFQAGNNINCYTPDYVAWEAGWKTTIDSTQCSEVAGMRSGTCSGQFPYTTCINYVSCEGFYNEQLRVCPSVFEALGGASGYISLWFGVCATLHRLIGKYVARKQAQATTTELSEDGKKFLSAAAPQEQTAFHRKVSSNETEDGVAEDMVAVVQVEEMAKEAGTNAADVAITSHNTGDNLKLGGHANDMNYLLDMASHRTKEMTAQVSQQLSLLSTSTSMTNYIGPDSAPEKIAEEETSLTVSGRLDA